jgi:hypothetical protein
MRALLRVLVGSDDISARPPLQVVTPKNFGISLRQCDTRLAGSQRWAVHKTNHEYSPLAVIHVGFARLVKIMAISTYTTTALKRWSCQDHQLPSAEQVKEIHVYDFDNTRVSTTGQKLQSAGTDFAPQFSLRPCQISSCGPRQRSAI